MTIQRYEAEIFYEPFHSGFDENKPKEYVKMSPIGRGKWVRYDDVGRTVAEL